MRDRNGVDGYERVGNGGGRKRRARHLVEVELHRGQGRGWVCGSLFLFGWKNQRAVERETEKEREIKYNNKKICCPNDD
jgi:hypothetical protein